MATTDNTTQSDPKQTPNAGDSAAKPESAAAAGWSASDTSVQSADQSSGRGSRSNERNSRGGNRWRRGRRWRRDKPKKEYDEVLLEVRRVTRVTTWWRQLSFRAIILIWNRKGKVGLWVAKGWDVSIAVRKAAREANKNIIEVPITESQSVPYETVTKYKSARVKLIPAADGTWLKAWSSVRSVLELAGYSNILSKIMGTNNKLNNAIATLHALWGYKSERLKKIHWKKDQSADKKTADNKANEETK